MALSEEEKAWRRGAADRIVASLRAGDYYEPCDEDLADLAGYAEGDVTFNEMRKRITARMQPEEERREIVDEMVASCRAEGCEPSGEDFADLEAYVAGDLTIEDIRARIAERIQRQQTEWLQHEEEKAHRRKLVRWSAAVAGIGSGQLDPEYVQDQELYIEGELTMDQVRARGIERIRRENERGEQRARQAAAQQASGSAEEGSDDVSF